MRLPLTVRLAWGLLVARPGQALVLLLIAMLLAGSVGLSSALVASSEAALRAGLEADHAGRPFSVQAGTPRSAVLLDQQPGLEPVRDEQVALTRADLRTSGLLRVSRTSLPLGVLTRGVRPRDAGEVTVSEAVRKELALDIGDEVTVEAGAGTAIHTVTGITVDPADPASGVVVGLRALDPTDATLWLAEDDPYANPQLEPEFDLRSMTFTEVAALADERRGDLPPAVLALRHHPLALGLLLGVMVVGVVAASGARAARDAAALQAAGLSGQHAWRPLVLLMTASLVVGELVGFLVAWCVLQAFGRRVGDAFGQYWTETTVPLGVVAVVVGLTVLLCAGASWPVRRLHAWWSRGQRRSWDVPGWLLVAAGGVVLAAGGVLAWAALGPADGRPEKVVIAAPVAALAVAVAAPVTAAGLVALGEGVATARALRRMVGLVLPAVVGVSVLSAGAGLLTSRVHHQADVATQRLGTIEAAGTLAMHEVPTDAAVLVVEKFRELGGEEVTQFALPDERTSQGRVTQPGVVDCVREESYQHLFDVPLSCYATPNGPINLIAVSDRAGGPVLADPELVRDGEVGLLKLRSGGDEIEAVEVVEATPDPGLGGNLPGLVLPEGSPAARSMGLSDGGTRMVILHDFGSLTPVEQSRLRGLVARTASAAQVLDSSRGDEPSRRRGLAALASFAVAAVAFSVLAVAGMGAVLGSRSAAQGLDAVGAGARFRRRLRVRMLSVPVVSLLVSGCAVAGANRAVRAVEGTSFGLTWPVPMAAALVAVALLAPWWLRVSSGR